MKLGHAVTHVLYDMDGILLDTEQFYTKVTQAIVAEYGKVFDWSIKSHMIGLPSSESARYLVKALDLPISPEEYLERRGVELHRLFPESAEVAGAEAFTRGLAEAGVPQAVATSSEKHLFQMKTSKHHSAWFSIFDAVIVGDDPRVKNGKPAPDIFLVAAEELGAQPKDCVVIEDSPAGVAAAVAAGMQVVAIPDPQMDRGRYGAADLVVDSYADLAYADLGFQPARPH